MENEFDLLEQMPRAEVRRKSVGQIAAIAAGAVVILLLAGYLICCAVVDQNTVLGHYVVNGTDLQGMTKEGAAAALEAVRADDYTDISIPVTVNGETYQVSVADLLTVDIDATVEGAMQAGHGSFMTRGAALIASLFETTETGMTVDVTNLDLLRTNIEASGLLEAAQSVVAPSYEVQEGQLLITKGASGETVDEDALAALLETQLRAGDYTTPIACPLTEASPEELDLQAVYDAVHAEMSNATLDPANNYAIVASTRGVDFDLAAAQTAYDAAGEGEQISVPLTYTEPTVTTSALEENLFADRLGRYSTDVSGTSARRANVRLAAETIDGVILLAGETFSYNDVVGEGNAEQGYQEAIVYQDGLSVLGVGGGICQVSTTLYNAAMLANLEITERHAHSYPSSYVPLGRDATVSYGSLDFQFTNNTDYPIKIVTYYDSDYDVVYCSIYGTDVNHYSVEITNEVLSTNPYSVVEEETDELYVGETETTITGYTGYTVQTYRYVYDADGNLVSSGAESYSAYKRRDEVVRVGTKQYQTTVADDTSDDDASDDTATGGTTGGDTTGDATGGDAGDDTGDEAEAENNDDYYYDPGEVPGDGEGEA